MGKNKAGWTVATFHQRLDQVVLGQSPHSNPVDDKSSLGKPDEVWHLTEGLGERLAEWMIIQWILLK